MTAVLALRRQRTSGVRGPLWVFVDGAPVASLTRRSALRVPVRPGLRVLTADLQGIPLPALEIEVVEGEVVDVELWLPKAIYFDMHHVTIQASVRGEFVTPEGVRPRNRPRRTWWGGRRRRA